MTEENKALQNYKEQIKKELAGNKTAITTGGSSKITAKNKVFSLPDGTSSSDPIQVVVLEFTNSNAYYDKPYKQGEHSPPSCWAKGKGEMKPDGAVSEPQAEACEGCAHNEYETALGGGKGKRCSQSVQIAVVPPTTNGTEEPMTFNIPATSIKSWGNHVAKLNAKEEIPAMVITEISFNPSFDYNNFLFKEVGPVPDLNVVMPMKPEALAILG